MARRDRVSAVSPVGGMSLVVGVRASPKNKVKGRLMLPYGSFWRCLLASLWKHLKETKKPVVGASDTLGS
ncbi:MAG: hypothetical protein RLZZ338_3383 [Cyanobacteriota bacterium]|jgi:hypothetical protein